jgi:hypothetical protein
VTPERLQTVINQITNGHTFFWRMVLDPDMIELFRSIEKIKEEKFGFVISNKREVLKELRQFKKFLLL